MSIVRRAYQAWSRSSRVRAALIALLVACAGCGHGYHPRTLPAPVSQQPAGAGIGGGLHAGFGRADITPPPGVGLSGYGPESKRARGYRLRLYARALVLEDSRGERIAFVVADLGLISPLLHRLTAQRVAGSTGIGADRFVLAATHTHSGPGHYFAAKQFNDQASSVAGFDSVVVEFLVSRMAAALSVAAGNLRPARVAWGSKPVWGHTRNRSYEAFVRNESLPRFPPPPPGREVSEPYLSVDPIWWMLRVDLLDPSTGTYVPAGALSTFAIHGTGNPSANDLFDGDIHALVQRGLEEHIDRLNGRNPGFHPQAVHLLANGADGDVSPDWPEETRCAPPKLRPTRRAGGPRTPPAPEGWITWPDARIARCLSAARRYIDTAGASLASEAIAMFDGLGEDLASDITVARAFRTVPLKGESAPPALCDQPRIGAPSIGGAEDGRTRYYGWRFLGLFPSGFAEGKASAKPTAGGCHGPKRIALGPLQGLIVGPHGFPEVVQLTVVRVGKMLLGTVPAEATTGAGVRLKAMMRHAAEAAGSEADEVALIGLANGHILYVTTREEYEAQGYEGASVLYGPMTTAVLGEQLGELVAELDPARRSSPEPWVDTIIAYPGKSRAIFPDANAGPPPERIHRAITSVSCQGNTIVIGWNDAYPGRLIPADGPVLRIERETRNGGREIVVWDDDPNLEVRAVLPQGRRGYLWEARWTPQASAGRHRVVLIARPGLAQIEGEPFEICR